jgi:hypothetical protein
MLVLLAGSAFLAAPWRTPALAAQALFYGWGAVGWLASRRRRAPMLLYVPFYFLALAGAGIAGLYSVVRGTDLPFWEPRK